MFLRLFDVKYFGDWLKINLSHSKLQINLDFSDLINLIYLISNFAILLFCNYTRDGQREPDTYSPLLLAIK